MEGFLTPSELTDLLGSITIQGVYKILKTHNIDSSASATKRRKINPLGVRKLLEERGFVYPRKNLSFQIVKGGVGKTSLSYALGLRASHYGARVLLVDFDQQGNLTRSFNVDARNSPVWLNVVRDSVSVEKAIIPLSETLSLLPSSLNNSRLDIELTQSNPNLRDTIKDKISGIRDNFDLVIFDCPPAINKISLSATCASDIIVIPITPDPYAMDGLDFTLSEIGRIKKEFKLKIDTKIVWNRYDARERLGAVYMHSLAKDEDKIKCVMPVVIRVDTSLKNSIFDATSIFEFTKKPNIREDLDQFAREMLGINQFMESYKKKTS